MSHEEPWSFEQWQREQETRYASIQRRMRETLERGGAVIETLGTREKAWRLGNGPFIEPHNSDPVYLADHLISRHRGFGTLVEFEEPAR